MAQGVELHDTLAALGLERGRGSHVDSVQVVWRCKRRVGRSSGCRGSEVWLSSASHTHCSPSVPESHCGPCGARDVDTPWRRTRLRVWAVQPSDRRAAASLLGLGAVVHQRRVEPVRWRGSTLSRWLPVPHGATCCGGLCVRVWWPGPSRVPTSSPCWCLASRRSHIAPRLRGCTG